MIRVTARHAGLDHTDLTGDAVFVLGHQRPKREPAGIVAARVIAENQFADGAPSGAAGKAGGWKDRRAIAVAVAAGVALPAPAGFTLGRSSPIRSKSFRWRAGLPRETVSFSPPGTPLAMPVILPTACMCRSAWAVPHQGTADVVRPRFSGDADGGGSSIARVDDVLHLPVNLGDPADPPRRILLHCRNDVVARVQYISRNGVSKDFPVVRTMMAEGK